jgi:spermidine/putrescine-binding protein
MCIPKGTQNKLIAERYINYMLSEEPAVANAEYTYYASPNKLVRENEKYIEYMNDIKDGAFDLMYNTEVEVTPYKNLDKDKLILLNSLWEELKSDVRIDPLIYVVCAGIILSLSSFGVYIFFRNRKRRRYQNSI